eukprot:588561-Prorocentrum_minimum.AAC.1
MTLPSRGPRSSSPRRRAFSRGRPFSPPPPPSRAASDLRRHNGSPTRTLLRFSMREALGPSAPDDPHRAQRFVNGARGDERRRECSGPRGESVFRLTARERGRGRAPSAFSAPATPSSRRAAPTNRRARNRAGRRALTRPSDRSSEGRRAAPRRRGRPHTGRRGVERGSARGSV